MTLSPSAQIATETVCRCRHTHPVSLLECRNAVAQAALSVQDFAGSQACRLCGRTFSALDALLSDATNSKHLSGLLRMASQ